MISQSSQLSIITSLEEFNDRIFQDQSAFYNLVQVERLEAEADRRGPVISPTNSDLASPTSDSLFAFTDETE